MIREILNRPSLYKLTPKVEASRFSAEANFSGWFFDIRVTNTESVPYQQSNIFFREHFDLESIVNYKLNEILV